MGDLKKLKALRGVCKGKITRIEIFINDSENFANATADVLETRKTLLVDAFRQYENVELEITCLDSAESESTDSVCVVEDKYVHILAKLNEQIKSLNKTTTTASNISAKNLPDIDLTPFDGKDFSKFRPFYELFLAVIDNNKSLTDVAKLFYLRKYLIGDALSIIINLPLEGHSYKEALDLLRKRYDNKCRLITNHVNSILDVQPMQKGTAASIRAFVSHIQQHLTALKNLEQPVSQWNMLLIPILCRKLDQYTNRAFQLDRDSETLPTVSELVSFLDKRAVALEDSSTPGQSNNFENSKNKSRLSALHVVNFATKSYQCRFCNATNHEIHGCPKYKLASIEVRKNFVKEHKLCLICLKGHGGKCKYTFKCRVCKGSHHSLLHEDIHASSNAATHVHEDIRADSNAVTLLSNKLNRNVLLPTVKVKVVDKQNRDIYVRALLDSGSQASFVTSALIKQLNLSPIEQTSKIIGITNQSTKIDQYVNLTIQSCMENSNAKFNIQCNVVDSITAKLPQQHIDISMLKLPKGITLADDKFNEPSEVGILLGADLYFKVMLDGHIKLPNGLVLQNTQFGYVVGGGYGGAAGNKNNYKIVTNFVTHDNARLDDIMENFWISEKIPEPENKNNIEFHNAEKIFEESVVLENNRFYVDLPLVAPVEQLDLGNSFVIALQRFFTLEKRLMRNTELSEQYKKFIKQYLDLGHAKIVDIAEYDVNNGPVYFLAHHAVLNEQSKTTKLRVVFDGAMKSLNQTSLNDVMLNGPVVQHYMDSLCKDHFLQRQYRKLDGGVLWSRNERNLDCTVTFQTHSILQRFMLHFDLLQLDCNDHLYVYDGAHDTASPKADLSCRNTKQQIGALFTRSNFVTLKYVTDNWGTDANGFKLVITAVKDPKHGCKQFRCKQREFCVSADLTCDGVDHCADGSDEDTAALCPESGSNAAWSSWVVVGGASGALLLLATAAAACCLCRRRTDPRSHLQLQQMASANGGGVKNAPEAATRLPGNWALPAAPSARRAARRAPPRPPA